MNVSDNQEQKQAQKQAPSTSLAQSILKMQIEILDTLENSGKKVQSVNENLIEQLKKVFK